MPLMASLNKAIVAENTSLLDILSRTILILDLVTSKTQLESCLRSQRLSDQYLPQQSPTIRVARKDRGRSLKAV